MLNPVQRTIAEERKSPLEGIEERVQVTKKKKRAHYFEPISHRSSNMVDNPKSNANDDFESRLNVIAVESPVNNLKHLESKESLLRQSPGLRPGTQHSESTVSKNLLREYLIQKPDESRSAQQDELLRRELERAQKRYYKEHQYLVDEQLVRQFMQK